MINIYSEDKVIHFTAKTEEIPADAVLYPAIPEDIRVAKVMQILEKIKSLNIVSSDPYAVAEYFISQFYLRAAAGGLVDDGNDNYLWIYRNGRWDLPKGHIEQGESPEQGALREVREECGIDQLHITGELPVTYHFYMLDGKCIMKRTHWFSMTTSQKHTVAQAEEGITAVEWVGTGELPVLIASTYGSVREVVLAGTGKNLENLNK